MKKWTFVLLCLFLSIGLASAQTKVFGVVLSAEDGQPVIGASVVVKGTSTGTVTDTDGKFSLSVPASGKTLVVSYVGMESQELAVKSSLRAVLKSKAKALDEVVVTALGIKRSQKALGYAATTVKNEELTAAKSSSMISGLAGKVAGLNVSAAGGTGTSQKVIVRGYTSFTNNQPLYIIDGMSMMNDFMGNSTTSNSVDFGNLANDINPEDIESVTVLKGASATALYGSRAANGVIMITTKRGKKNQKVSVVYDGSYTASSVLRVPQTQKLFGEGWPYWDGSENGSWGPKLDGREHEWGAWSVEDYKGDAPVGFESQKKKFSYAENSLRDFYETGAEIQNNLSISGGNEISSFVLSYGNTYSNGVIPTDADTYKRNSLSFRGNSKYKRLTSSYDLNYVNKNIKAVSAGQGDDGATLFQEIAQIPVDIYIPSLKDFNSTYNNSDNYFTWYAQNPYWVVANNGNSLLDDRIYGKIELDYELFKGLNFINRVSGDFSNSTQKNWNAIAKYSGTSWSSYGGKTIEPGSYSQESRRYEQLELTSMLSATSKLSADVSVNGVAGFNVNHRAGSRLTSSLFGLKIPNFYNLGNSTDLPTTTTYEFKRRLVGAFGQADLSYRDWAFLTLSYRNDWSSTLPKDDNNFGYYGVNGSIILSEMLKKQFGFEMNGVNYLKMRLAYGQTGNDASQYLLYDYYPLTSMPLGYGDLVFPLNQVLGHTLGNRLGNNTLKPEITTEAEFGLEGKFLDGRLGFDVALYNKNTKDQIIATNIGPESGYSTRTRNVGRIENKGVELALYGTPIKLKDFSWDLGVTYAKNQSKVKELWSDNGEAVTKYQITSAYQVAYMAIVGEPLGVFQVPQVATTADGKVIVNSSGRPIIDPVNKKTVGSSSPDFTMGFTSKIKYKGLSLSAAVDWRSGGYFWSNTAEMLAFDGNSTLTTFNERQPFIVPNSVYNAGTTSNPKYIENYIPIPWTSMYSYYNHSTNLAMYEKMVLDRTYVKLREVVLTYQLPKKWLAGSAISNIDISLIGRNLLLFTPATNNFVDPEATNYGNDLGSEFGEFSAGPTNRNFGAAVRVEF